MPRSPVLLLLLLPAVAAMAGGAAPRAERLEWSFDVALDGSPIGRHRFVVERNVDADRASVRSDARFDVTLLGLSLYRYRHVASEAWSGGCLAALDARTEDDGKVVEVRGAAARASFALRVSQPVGNERPADASIDGCVMTFAYWNPALAGQRRLLDPGTGRLQAVSIAPLPAAPIDVEGKRAVARGLRIAGLTHPIDVWYDGDRWIGLDTRVDGGRRLTYRLQ